MCGQVEVAWLCVAVASAAAATASAAVAAATASAAAFAAFALLTVLTALPCIFSAAGRQAVASGRLACLLRVQLAEDLLDDLEGAVQVGGLASDLQLGLELVR